MAITLSTRTAADALARELARAAPNAGALGALDFEALSAQGRIDALVACERLARLSQGLLARALGALDRARRGEDAVMAGVTETEVQAALLWSANYVQSRLAECGALAERFPETLEALESGSVCWMQARALVEVTNPLEDEQARAVQDRVLARMPEQSVAATRKALRRAAQAVDPHASRLRHEQQRARRRLHLIPEEDGMATLALYTAAETATALYAAIDRHVRACPADDARSVDQRRADALASLVLAGAGVPCSRTTQGTEITPAALVQITVSLDTLRGANDEPADLGGYGPITATQARALAFAPGSVWRRLITSPDGILLHTDPHTYRPVRMWESGFPGLAAGLGLDWRASSARMPGAGMLSQPLDPLPA